jgi:alpha-tubulin suppressor-like RCC1 family protein
MHRMLNAFRYKILGAFSALCLIMSCQPPIPEPVVVSAVRIESISTTILAGSSLELNGFIEGNNSALNSGLSWRVVRGSVVLSSTVGQKVLLLAPQFVSVAAESEVVLTSLVNPSKSFSLTVTVQPVVSDVQLSASRISLRSQESTFLVASVLGSGNTDLVWSIDSGSGFLRQTGLNRFVFVAPAVREAVSTRIRVASSIDSSREAFLTLLILPWKNSLALGTLHSLAIKSDGSLWAWGSNLYGAVRPSSSLLEPLPASQVTVPSSQADAAQFNSFVQVAAGAFHQFALSASGSLWAWGLNSEGQLGLGHADAVQSPQKVLLEDVVAISAGEGHSLALLRDGRVFAWGRNVEGQLGSGNLSSQTQPRFVPLDARVVQISAGSFFSLALLEDGRVMGWGDNRSGQLGIDPKDVSFSSVPRVITGVSDLIQISAGGRHVLGLTRDGLVYAWGANDFGQLGDTSLFNRFLPVLLSLESILQVVAGQDHSLALSQSSQVYVWGSHVFGQLGNLGEVKQVSPTGLGLTGFSVFAGSQQSGLILPSGDLTLFGKNQTGQILLPVTPTQSLPVTVFSSVLSP